MTIQLGRPVEDVPTQSLRDISSDRLDGCKLAFDPVTLHPDHDDSH